MRIAFAVGLMLACVQALADSWTGATVKVPAGTLMCEYSLLESAMELDSEGGASNLDSTLEKSACLYSPKELLAQVAKEAFDSEGQELLEVRIGSTTIWVAKENVACCFE